MRKNTLVNKLSENSNKSIELVQPLTITSPEPKVQNIVNVQTPPNDPPIINNYIPDNNPIINNYLLDNSPLNEILRILM